MNFRIKSNKQFKRDRVQLSTLKQLLIPSKLIQLPEQNLNKIIIDSSPKSYSPQRQKRQHFGERSKSSTHFNNASIAHSLRAYQQNQEIKRNTLKSLRKTWNPQQAKQEHKRLTMQHFRHQSLELPRQKYHSKIQIINIHRKPSQFVTLYYHDSPLNKTRKEQRISQEKDNEKSGQNINKTGHKKRLEYLKKGSDINKRVVTNLLKLKLAQNNIEQQNEQNKAIRNNEILRMIKICKGYGQRPEIDKLRQSNRSKLEHIANLKSDPKQNLEIRLIPFKNINIELSISQWQNKNMHYHQQIEELA